MENDKVLKRIYYDEKNYAGVNELYRIVKTRHYNISKEYIKAWLNKQSGHVMQTEKVGKQNYLPIYSEIPYAFQMDLTFFPRYKNVNKGYYVLFTAININTRYAYAYIAKDKEMDTILDLIKEMEKKTVINSFTSDYGGEFYNTKFREYCESKNISNYFVKDDSHKLGIINRFHRTLKEKLTKHFVINKTTKWIDVIDKIVYNYNRSFNRGIGSTPYNVENNPLLEATILEQKKAVTGIVKKSVPEFVVGDKVMLKRKRELFDDKMTSKHINKKYVVVGVTANSLQLVDSKGKQIKVKKSTATKVNNDVVDHVHETNDVEEDVQRNRRIPKSDVDTNLILQGKRVRKQKVRD